MSRAAPGFGVTVTVALLVMSGLLAVGVAPARAADPVPANPNYYVVPDTSFSGNVLADQEPPGYRVSLTVAPVNGTIVLNADGSFTYRPRAGYVGVDSFHYCLTLDAGCLAGDGVASLYVGAAPQDREYPVEVNVPATGNVTDGQWSPDLGPLQTTDLEHGTMVLNYGDGSFTYTPDTDYVGVDSFEYCLSPDQATCLSDDRATVTFTVTGQVGVVTTTTLAGPGILLFGQPAALTATVAPTVDGGTVTFAASATDVAECADLPIVASAATCTLDAPLEPGPHAFTAHYSGAGDALPSISAPATTLVLAAPTSVTYTGADSGDVGVPLQVSAQLTNNAAGAAGPIPGESVRFGMADGLSCTAVTDAAGVAECTLMPNRVGRLAVTVLFGGDVRYLPTQVDGAATIAPQPSITTLQATPNPAPWGEPVTLTATVPAGATGTVAFEVAGTVLPGCAAVPVAEGAAGCVTDGLDVGSRQVSATYSGDADVAGSSGSTTVQINQRTIDLAFGGPSTGMVGGPLALSAIVTDALAGPPLSSLRVATTSGDAQREGIRAAAAAAAAPDLAGLPLLFTLGSAQCEGITDADGVASCSLTPSAAGDPAELTISFGGTAVLAAAQLAVPIVVAAEPVPTPTPGSPVATVPTQSPTSGSPAGTEPAAPAPPSADGLATTGATVGGLLVAGLVLLGFGTLLVLVGRQRTSRPLR
ncbi:Ig-like domain repeat protein [Occultella aeris]|nr:Ig-like domain repeat protein [Occultella aeris]